MKLLREQTCYLCGSPIPSGEATPDHVPPKQVYPSKYLAKGHLKNLFTLPTHEGCNIGYQRDEDYFFQSVGPLAFGTQAGNAFWQDFRVRIRRPQNRGLTKKVLKEFQPTTEAGLYLPTDKMLKRFEGERVWRVIWKIVRGLFVREYGRGLPEEVPRKFDIGGPDHQPPKELASLANVPSRGQHPAFFDYRYVSIKELDNFHYWALLFWSQVVFVAAFHDPDCPCDQCSQGQVAEASPVP